MLFLVLKSLNKMKKAFTLIELLVYISILSILLITIFKFLIAENTEIIYESNNKIINEDLIKNYHIK